MSVGMPTHYQLRLDHISHEVSRLSRSDGNTIVLLGDAHVEANPIKDLGGCHVINMGIQEDVMGMECKGLKDRLWLLPMARPSHVVIMAGLNDLRDGRNPAQVEACFKDVVNGIRKSVPSAVIHLALIPPTREKYEKLMHDIALTNCMIEEMAARLNLEYVDLFSPLEDDDGHLATLYSEDGYYLNDTGYDKLNAMLERHISQGDRY